MLLRSNGLDKIRLAEESSASAAPTGDVEERARKIERESQFQSKLQGVVIVVEKPIVYIRTTVTGGVETGQLGIERQPSGIINTPACVHSAPGKI